MYAVKSIKKKSMPIRILYLKIQDKWKKIWVLEGAKIHKTFKEEKGFTEDFLMKTM